MDWLAGLLDRMRATPVESNLFQVPATAQVFAFQVTSPDVVLVLVARDPRLPASHWSWGPLPAWQLHRGFEELLAHPLWQQPFRHVKPFVPPRDPTATMRQLVAEPAIRRMREEVRRTPFFEPRKHGFSAMLLPSDCALWAHHGTLETLDEEEWLAKLAPPPKAASPSPNAPAASPAPAPPAKPPEPEHHAVECSPRLRVGAGKPAPLWRILQDPSFRFPEHDEALRTTLAGVPLRVTHEGLLAFEGADQDRARALAAAVMVALSSTGRAAKPVRADDMARLTLGEHGWSGSFPNREAGDPRWEREPEWISLEGFRQVLAEAERLGREVPPEELDFFLEAQWHAREGESAQSLLFSWAMLERWMAREWAALLERRKVTGPRRENLKSKAIWSFDHQAEALEFEGTLDPGLAEEVRAVRRARNKTFHGGAMATREDAERALKVARRLAGIGEPTEVKP